MYNVYNCEWKCTEYMDLERQKCLELLVSVNEIWVLIGRHPQNVCQQDRIVLSYQHAVWKLHMAVPNLKGKSFECSGVYIEIWH